MEESRSDDGRFTPEHTDAEILAAVRTHEPAATSEVADELGMTRQGADRRLRRLRDAGDVNSKKIGASLVWFAPDERAAEDHAERARERDEQRPTVEDEHLPGDGGTPEHARHTPPETGVLDDALDGWEPDTDANPRTARAQTRRAAEWLQTVGEYRRAGELKDALAGESALTERVWWERNARPGLNHLADVGLVEYVKNRGYRWTAEEDSDGDGDSGVYDPTGEF